jgi:hypothetical protein
VLAGEPPPLQKIRYPDHRNATPVGQIEFFWLIESVSAESRTESRMGETGGRLTWVQRPTIRNKDYLRPRRHPSASSIGASSQRVGSMGTRASVQQQGRISSRHNVWCFIEGDSGQWEARRRKTRRGWPSSRRASGRSIESGDNDRRKTTRSRYRSADYIDWILFSKRHYLIWGSDRNL